MSDNHTHNHDHDHDHDHITLIDEDGNEELFEILLTFESDEFEKSYVLVYPTSSEEEELEIFAFSYIEEEGGLDGNLSQVETDEEWEMIEEVLGAFIEDEDDEEE